MKKFLFTTALMAIIGTASALAETWTAPSPQDYEGYMPVSIEPKVNGQIVHSGIEYAAFIDGELRGYTNQAIELVTPTTTTASYYYDLKVYGNDEDKDKEVTVRIKYNGVEYAYSNSLSFDRENRYVYPYTIDLTTINKYAKIELKESYLLNAMWNETAYLTSDLMFTTADGGTIGYRKMECQPVLEWTVTGATQNIELTNGEAKAVAANKGVTTVTVKTGSLSAQTAITTYYPVQEIALESPITLEKGSSINLMDKLTFTLRIGYSATQQPLTVTKKASETNVPEVEFSVGNYVNYAKVEGSTLTALTGTDANGIELTAEAHDMLAMDGQLEAKATVYITPYDYQIKSLAFKQGLYDLNLTDKKTVNLLNQLEFTLITSKWEDATETTVKKTYAELDYKPEIQWTSADGQKVELSQAGVAEAKASTGIDGIQVTAKLTLQGIDATTQVAVTPYVYAIRGIRWTTEQITFTVGNEVELLDYLEFEAVTSVGTTETKEWIKASAMANSLADLSFAARSNYLIITGTKMTASQPVVPAVGLHAVFSNYSADVLVSALAQKIPVESIAIDMEVIEVGRGESVTFTVKATPDGATVDPEALHFTVTSANSAESQQWGDLISIEENAGAALFTFTATGRYVGKGTLKAEYVEEGINANTTVSVNVGAVYEVTEGWSWISLYMVDDNMATPAGLDDVLFGGQLYDLRSQTQSTYNDATYGFFGDLTAITNGAYHAKALEASTATIYGTRKTDAQTLYKGWTWLYYPYQWNSSLNTLATAFGALKTGDMVISKTDGFAVRGTNGWSSNLTLRAGESYLVKSAAAGTITWPAETTLSMPEPGTAQHAALREASAFNYDASKWASNMSIIAQLDTDGREMQIGAYVGDECRGEGRLVEMDGKQYYFITVHGNAGEKVTFRAYDGMDYYSLSATLRLTTAAGTLDEPFSLGTGLDVNGIHTLDADHAEQQAAYDLMGRRTASRQGLVFDGGKSFLK